MATIVVGVETQGATAADALHANAAKADAMIAALKRGGIDAHDIQTSGLNLNPQYVYAQNEPAKLTGYQATNQVTVTVKDLGRSGRGGRCGRERRRPPTSARSPSAFPLRPRPRTPPASPP